MDLEVHLRRMYKTDRDFAEFIDGMGIEPDKEEILRAYRSINIERMLAAEERARLRQEGFRQGLREALEARRQES